MLAIEEMLGALCLTPGAIATLLPVCGGAQMGRIAGVR